MINLPLHIVDVAGQGWLTALDKSEAEGKSEQQSCNAGFEDKHRGYLLWGIINMSASGNHGQHLSDVGVTVSVLHLRVLVHTCFSFQIINMYI